MAARTAITRSDKGAATLIVVIVLMMMALTLVLLTLVTGEKNIQHQGAARQETEAHFVLMAAVNQSLAELNADADSDADGHKGAVATGTNPAQFRNSQGRIVGEYRAYIVNKAGVVNPNFSDYDPAVKPPFHVIRALVAIPSFAIAESTDPVVAARGRLLTAEIAARPNSQFAFHPKAGAVSIAGPINNTSAFVGWGDADFQIAGGTYPGIVVTDLPTRNRVIGMVGDRINNGNLTNPLTELTGSPSITYNHKQFNASSSLTNFNASIVHESGSAFTAQMMNDYRDALRGYAQTLVNGTDSGSGTAQTVNVNYSTLNAATGTMTNGAGQTVTVLHEVPAIKTGGGVGNPRITSNLTLGTPASPQIVLLDSSKFGSQTIVDNHGDAASGRTITGAGTLVIMHPIGSTSDGTAGKMFNLNWTGDVIVVGYPKDRASGEGKNGATDNMLYLSKADWTVNGNLVVVTAGATESSLELSSDNASNKATLTVNGSLMMFAEASTQEAEIDIEQNAQVTVNGLAQIYGSRLEIEDAGSGTGFEVNGTFTLGLPAGNTRSDDLILRTSGNSKFTFNETNVTNAIAGLTALNANLSLNSNDLTSLLFSAKQAVTRRTRADLSTWKANMTTIKGLTSPKNTLGVDRTLYQ